MRRVLLALLLVLPAASFSADAGLACPAATPVRVGDRAAGNTLVGLDQHHARDSWGFPRNGELAHDHVYALHLDAPAVVLVRVDAKYPAILYARSACDDVDSEIGYDNRFDDEEVWLNLPLPAGTTWFFVDGYLSTHGGPYEISFEVGEWETPEILLDLDWWAPPVSQPGSPFWLRGRNLTQASAVAYGGVPSPVLQRMDRDDGGVEVLYTYLALTVPSGPQPVSVTTPFGTTTVCCLEVEAGFSDIEATIELAEPPAGGCYAPTDTIPVRVTIRNLGDAWSASGSFAVNAEARAGPAPTDFYGDAAHGTYPQIAPGASVQHDATVPARGFVGDVTLTVSTTSWRVERNAANNRDGVETCVAAPADGNGVAARLVPL